MIFTNHHWVLDAKSAAGSAHCLSKGGLPKDDPYLGLCHCILVYILELSPFDKVTQDAF